MTYTELKRHCQENPDFGVIKIRYSPASFDNMIEKIRENTTKVLLNLQVQQQPQPPQPAPYKVNFVGKELTKEEREAKAKGKLQVQKTIVNNSPKVGRNDPCPCGSGKKYKNCCWAKDNAQ